MIALFLILIILIGGTVLVKTLEVTARRDNPQADLPNILYVVPWLLAGLILFFSTVVIINAGHVGVVKQLGAVNRTMNPGLSVKTPFFETVEILDTRVQKQEAEADAASKDLQTVKAKVALNYRLLPTKAAQIVQEMGNEYKERVIDPSVQEAVKAATAKFTAEELITRREAVREEVKVNLKNKLEFRGIVVDEFNIVNFDFSPSFNQAIEAKVTAEQNALAAKNKLEQVKFEAEQQVAQAEGKAKAIEVEAAALRNNPQIAELRKIERWNGVLPNVMTGGGTIPFINVNP